MDLSSWKGVPRPERITLEGRYARLEPLDPGRHGDDLFTAAVAPGAEDRFRYLPDNPPADRAAFSAWLETCASSSDPLFFATIDRRTNRAEGRQALMRVDPAHGVVEVGHILWGPGIARSRVTTEAIYLLASYVFDTHGYRRFEWKCNNRNEPSRRAAARFGFAHEGVFRQHMVIKGENRDTAWFAMLDADWPRLKPGYERWLHPDNFEADGTQKTKLTFDSV
ncbi:unnamed protein product [Bemisia tabaci]|uniref:N-acetyltransferase domain-containing protein n=1 Tax=Bemisia tabaci TaxID=7038 RepID=A0A9P0AGM6_BEMTA|nr:unnamed protein product [Bemisia tabaci]